MPDTTDSIVEFKGVQKSYDGDVLVIKGLNLSVRRGEFLTMLGPSGSGKTTVLMMLAGFESTTRGEILLNGTPISRVPPHRRGVGMVFQNYALFPHMTVAENLAFPLRVRRMGRAETEEKVRRALDMVRLPGFGARRPAQLSGGQQQRVAVARALVFEPDLILMDEPLGALDKNLREEMQYEIKHIHESLGVSVVYVTHDQSEALTMSNRVAVFDGGVIQQLAAPEVLYERPDNAFVAAFIGENNRLRGVVRDIRDGVCAVDLDGGGETRALRVAAEGVGAPTTLSLRPERVTINPAEGQCDNIRPARVEELIYLGDHIRARLTVAGNSDFIVKVPNAAGARPPRRGDDVRIGWLAADCRALDAQ